MFWVLPMSFIKLDRDIIIPWKSFTELVLCSMARPKADMLHLHKGLEIREIKCAHIISENHFSVGGGEGAKDKTITHFASWCQPCVQCQAFTTTRSCTDCDKVLQLHLAAARFVGQPERGKVEEPGGAQADGGQEIQRARFKESDRSSNRDTRSA